MNRFCECGCGKQVLGKNSHFRRGHNLNPSRPAAQRFWPRTKVGGGGCWEWQGERLACGYGRLRVGRKKVLAHRFAYELLRGPIPTGLFVCHHCDNRPCVNPDHLFLGTAADNARDMTAKGRHAPMGGFNHPNAKLTAEEILEVVRLRKAGVRRQAVAERYGISLQTVSLITCGKRWQCVTSSGSASGK